MFAQEDAPITRAFDGGALGSLNGAFFKSKARKSLEKIREKKQLPIVRRLRRRFQVEG